MVISIKTNRRNEFVEISQEVKRVVADSGATEGAVLVYCPHTTAGITINESYDPDVQRDMIEHLNQMVPESANQYHAEGNSDGHIKASLMGSSCMVPIINGQVRLGTWQGIYFCEFDGPRSRKVIVQLLPGV